MKGTVSNERFVKTSSALLTIVIVAIIGITINETKKIRDTNIRLAHTQKALFYSQKLLGHVITNESATRGYIITGQETFLASIAKSRQEILSEVSFAANIKRETPELQILIDSLLFYVERRIRFSDTTISIYDSKGADAAIAVVKSGNGKLHTDSIRAIVDRLQLTENDLLNQHNRTNRKAFQWQNSALVALAFAALLLLLILLRQVHFRFKLFKNVKEDLQGQVLTKTGELNTIFERLTDSFVALDRHWHFTYANKKACELFNMDPQNIIGRNIWTEFPEGITSAFYDACHEAMESQQNIYLEEYYAPKAVWFENHIYPSPDGLSIFFRDITDKKLSEEKLIHSEKRFRALVENSEDIITLVDEKFNVLFHSASAARITRRTNEKYEDSDPTRYVHPDDLQGFRNAMEVSIKNPGQNIPIAFRGLLENGEYVWLEGIIKNMLHDEAIGGIVGNMKDVTERKKAETALIESEKKFRSVVENMHEALIIEDRQGNLVYANPEFYRMFGYVPEEEINLNFKDYTAVSSYEEVLERHNKRIKGEKAAEEYEYTGLRKDGTEICIEARVSTVIENNKILFTQSLERDITARKTAEKEIRLSEKRTRKIFEAGIIGFIFWDVNGEILDANDHFLKMTGYSKKDLEEKKIHWNKMTPPEYAELDRKGLEQIAHAGICLPFEKEYICKDGSRLPVLLGATAFEGQDPEKGVAYVMDMSERKKAELTLKEKENYLRTILDTEPECVKILNIQGELISMNPAGLAMIEADNEKQVLGHLMSDLVNEKYRSGFNRLNKNVFKGIQGSFEFEMTGLKGTHRWLETHAAPLKDESGKITALLGITRDITERKLSEISMINTTEKLRELTSHLQTVREEERKRIAREIHDELGQQLTAIKMDAVWIDKQIPQEANAIKYKLQNIMELLDGSHQSVRKILNELRPAALEENGLLEALQWKRQQFTETTGTPVSFTTNKSHIKLKEEMVTCIFRIYQESLANIMRHARANKVKSSLNITNDMIILSIEDDGIGFDPITEGRKKRFGLLGMKERVYSLQGKFDMVSSAKKGTKILIHLPLGSVQNQEVVK